MAPGPWVLRHPGSRRASPQRCRHCRSAVRDRGSERHTVPAGYRECARPHATGRSGFRSIAAAGALAARQGRNRAGGGAERRSRHREIPPGSSAQGTNGRGAASGLGVSLFTLSPAQRSVSGHRSLAPPVEVEPGGLGCRQAGEARTGAEPVPVARDGVRAAARRAALDTAPGRTPSRAHPHAATAEATDLGNRSVPPARTGRATTGSPDRGGFALGGSLHAGAPDPADGPGAGGTGHGPSNVPAGVSAFVGIACQHPPDHAPKASRSASRGDDPARDARQGPSFRGHAADRDADRRRAAVRRGADQDDPGVPMAREARGLLRAHGTTAGPRDSCDAARCPHGAPGSPRRRKDGGPARRHHRADVPTICSERWRPWTTRRWGRAWVS